MQKIVVILGPTSSGKTSAAIKLCKKFNGEIVSADSRQIYKFMDIGTGKIPFGTVVDVPIWLYDEVNPGEYFSAADYKSRAEAVIKDILARGKVPFIVGGTGFYIESLLGQQSSAPVPPNFELRRDLEKLSTEELAEKLRSLDNKRYEAIDKNNRRRLIRSVEISMSLVGPGLVPGRTPIDCGRPQGVALQLGLTASHEILYQRADAWVESAFQKGLIEETKKLIELDYKNTPQLNGLIYKTVLQFLDDQLTLEEAKQRVKFDIHGYIRRQETYFKKMPEINWLDVTDPAFDEKLSLGVESYLNG